MKRCSTKKIARHNNVLARLASFAKIEHPATNEVGYISLVYSCNESQAEKMIESARSYEAARIVAEKEPS